MTVTRLLDPSSSIQEAGDIYKSEILYLAVMDDLSNPYAEA
jgi:hypothetical protein